MWKATHIFSAKNIRILYIEFPKTVNEMTLNELVKLTMLWTTGPWVLAVPIRRQKFNFLDFAFWSTTLLFAYNPLYTKAGTINQIIY